MLEMLSRRHPRVTVDKSTLKPLKREISKWIGPVYTASAVKHNTTSQVLHPHQFEAESEEIPHCKHSNIEVRPCFFFFLKCCCFFF